MQSNILIYINSLKLVKCKGMCSYLEIFIFMPACIAELNFHMQHKWILVAHHIINFSTKH